MRATFPWSSDGANWAACGERTLLAPAQPRHPGAVLAGLWMLGHPRAQENPLPSFFACAVWPLHGQMSFSIDSSGRGGTRPRVGDFRCIRCPAPRRVLKARYTLAQVNNTHDRVIAWPDFQSTPRQGCCGR